jgi:hypothetical protein
MEIEQKTNRNSTLLISHNNTRSLHLYMKIKEDYISGKQKEPKTKLFLETTRSPSSSLHSLQPAKQTTKQKNRNKG